jgi:outer membrane protein assembly factor BamC
LVERNANDISVSILIKHHGMQEVLVGRGKETSRWQDRPRDAQLEMLFLQRLIESLGVTPEKAKRYVSQASF